MAHATSDGVPNHPARPVMGERERGGGSRRRPHRRKEGVGRDDVADDRRLGTAAAALLPLLAMDLTCRAAGQAAASLALEGGALSWRPSRRPCSRPWRRRTSDRPGCAKGERGGSEEMPPAE
jgi:hypothetical protein